MKNFKVDADPRVNEDLLEAIYFLNSKKIGLAKKFLVDYRSGLKTLKTNPFFEIRYDTIRCLPLEIFKYIIHFSIDEQNNIVHIHAVISTYKNPEESWL